jgi:ADP-ribose pyrophosphatase|tara:strand:+ start:1035 stop:1559 length:525 start_codon:yes stop_codon:yes gene_type:complete
MIKFPNPDNKKVYDSDSIHIVREKYNITRKTNIVKDYVNHPGSVLILSFLDEKILFVKQWRQPVKTYTLELPMGTLEIDENSIEAADREFREETGFRAKKYSSLGSYFVAPGYSSEKTEFFLAENLFESALLPDEDEEIYLEKYSLDNALDLITKQIIVDQSTICALLLYKSLL